MALDNMTYKNQCVVCMIYVFKDESVLHLQKNNGERVREWLVAGRAEDISSNESDVVVPFLKMF